MKKSLANFKNKMAKNLIYSKLEPIKLTGKSRTLPLDFHNNIVNLEKIPCIIIVLHTRFFLKKSN